MKEQTRKSLPLSDTDYDASQFKRMAESVYYYENLIDSVYDAIITTDLDYKITSWNRAAERLYGWTKSEALGRNVAELLHTRFSDVNHEQVLSKLMVGIPIEMEAQHTARNGNFLTVHIEISLLHDTRGSAVGTVGIVNDITRRKLMKDRFKKQSEEFMDKDMELIKIFDDLPMGTWIVDMKEEGFEYSTELDKCFGAGNLEGKQLFQHVLASFHPADRENLINEYNKCISQKKDKFEFEYRIQNGENEYLWVHSNVKITFDAEGLPSKLYGISFDTTNRKNKEILQLQQQEELKKTKKILDEELRAMNCIHNIGTRFVRENNLNAILADIVDTAIQITRADMCTIQLLDTKTGCLNIAAYRGMSQETLKHFSIIHEGDLASGSAQKNGKRVIVEDVMKSTFYTAEDMNVLSLAGVRAVQSTPLLGKSNISIGVLSTHYREPYRPKEWELRLLDMLGRLAADIIERASSETILQWNRQSTEILYETVDRLLAGEHTRAVIAELCLNIMNFLGCSVFLNYIYTDDRQKLMLNASAGVTTEQKNSIECLLPGQFECGIVAKSGCRIIIEDVQQSTCDGMKLFKSLGVRAYACHPLVVQDEVLGTLAFGTMDKDAFSADELALMKVVSGHVAVALNRVRAQENLERMTKELYDKNGLITDFFTNISHEFKTPLSIILVDLQLMEYRIRETDGELREKLGKMIAVMRQNALRLLRLIGNLLDVTKIDAGFMKVRLASIDIVELVKGLVESVGDIARNAGIDMALDCACERKVMPVDCEKMERIMLNLLSNAIKHTQPGGHITVHLKDEPGCIILSVKDDGEGIPADKQDFIFDRFRQANSSLTRSSEGCGIGLSLIKALVELLQGKIWLHSQPGAGSEFFVKLPVLADHDLTRTLVIEGMPRSRKVEMEFSDISKIDVKI